MISPDGQKDPALKDVEPGSDADATPVAEPKEPPPADKPDPAQKPAPASDKKQDVHFLANEFGIAPVNAAEMLADDGAEAETLAAEAMKEERERDPLDGVPVPAPDKDKDHLEPRIGDLEKPVAHRSSAPT